MRDPAAIAHPCAGAAKLTKDRLDTVIAALEAGNIREDAAAIAGVSRATLYAWIDEGEAALRDDDEGKPLGDRATVLCEFYLRYQRAIAGRTRAMLERMSNTESNAVVTSCTWQLTHFRPKEFAPPQRVELSGKDGGAIKHEINGDELLTRLEALAARNSGSDES